jgi:heat shock protein HtpX
MAAPARDFYEVQKEQRAKSIAVFFAVVAFYVLAVGLVALALVASVGLLVTGRIPVSSSFWSRLVLFDAALAVLAGGLHFLDAKRNGPRYILKRLQAAVPDPQDRYHKQFLNTLDEIRIAAGLPRVNGYVLPAFAVNSLALIEETGTPAVAVTEGLLAEGTRDELEAVAAHELAHIRSGDALYLTLVCSLANVFERFREALEPEPDDCRPAAAGADRGLGSSPLLVYFAVSLSALAMHLLSMLISRERELLADAAAVELCRSPDSLARAIYKAQVKNSFIGDFSTTYTPLFIVPPDARDVPDNLAGRMFNSHPPFMKRLGLLASMAHKSPQAIIEEVREGERLRGQARGVVHSFEEIKKGQMELFPGFGSGPAASSGPVDELAAAAEPGQVASPAEARIWFLLTGLLRKPEGPFDIGELVCHPRFSPLVLVRNAQEGVEAKAREFPQVRVVLGRLAAKKPLDPRRQNLCPRCRVPLAETFYEGVSVRACRSCSGKLVGAVGVDRIVARREVGFSDDRIAKARDFRERVLRNPIKMDKINASVSEEAPCPGCGYLMVPRPYNYQYFVPVDKCLSCSRIWFDADELEILQILIEEGGA